MRQICRFRFILYLLVTLAVVPPVLAGEPTEQIKETTEKAISVLSDPTFRAPERMEERQRRLREIADERFDWEEMARRSLARHWAQRTDEEKREFVALFSHLLERTYMDRVDNYSGEKVLYEGDTIDGDYGTVTVKIITNANTKIPAEYRVKRRENGWFIYDISVEGVSLINNYRTQFNSIILKSSYETLIKRLKAKVNEK
jgi:phospholipid transport system substrate-binding protein